jgi:hypothetical protein
MKTNKITLEFLITRALANILPKEHELPKEVISNVATFIADDIIVMEDILTNPKKKEYKLATVHDSLIKIEPLQPDERLEETQELLECIKAQVIRIAGVPSELIGSGK